MRTILLVGLYPYADQRILTAEFAAGAEVWGLNEVEGVLKPDRIKLDRLFQLHPRNWREAERRFLNGGRLYRGLNVDCFGRNRQHVEYLRTCGVPVYGQKVWPDIPT